MNPLTLQQIQGNGSDKIASTGHELVQAFNGNFDQVKEAIENLDQRLFNDLPVTSMSQLDDLRSGTYRILLTVSGGIEQFYLICTIDPDGRTVRQTRISDFIYTRIFVANKWKLWIRISNGQIDISQGFSILDTYNTPLYSGCYILIRDGIPAYYLLVTSDDMHHVVIQYLYGNSVIDDGKITAHMDSKVTILTRIYNFNASGNINIPSKTWGKWKYYQENFLKSELGISEVFGVTQKMFTERIGSERTSESEDGSLWGKIISIIQDAASNSEIISNLESLLSKSLLFKNIGTIARLDDLDDVQIPGYYTYTKSFHEGEAINGMLIVSQISYPGSFSFEQIRYELGKTYHREFDIDERVWLEWEEQLVVMSETAYEKLPFKDQFTFYYTYDD